MNNDSNIRLHRTKTSPIKNSQNPVYRPKVLRSNIRNSFVERNKSIYNPSLGFSSRTGGSIISNNCITLGQIPGICSTKMESKNRKARDPVQLASACVEFAKHVKQYRSIDSFLTAKKNVADNSTWKPSKEKRKRQWT